MTDAAAEIVTKHRVDMYQVMLDAKNDPVLVKATDYPTPDMLDAYVADARTKYPRVEVSEEPDAGPGGYHGQTHYPSHLNVPLAGQTKAATAPVEQPEVSDSPIYDANHPEV